MTPLNFGQVLIQDLGRCRTHIGECLFYYKNIYNGKISIEKALLPRKQNFTGWLSPEGFLFACEFTYARPLFDEHNYGDAAREILLSNGSETQGYQKDIEKLRELGWIFVVYSEPRQQRRPLNDIQIQVLKALKGADL